MKLKKALCLLLCAALVLSVGLPAVLAAADDDWYADTPSAYSASGEASAKVGDRVFIKAGTGIYSAVSGDSDYQWLDEDCEAEIVSITTDESGYVWYEVSFDGGEETYCYVRADNTTPVESDDPVDPEDPDEGDEGNEGDEGDEPDDPDAPAPDEYACSCGSEEENLANHADNCARKIYVHGLIMTDNGGYRTARQIYADWDSYDAATRTDILNMVETYVATEYEALREMVGEGEEPDPETPVGGVTVSGAPEGVTPTVSRAAPRNMSQSVLETIGKHRLAFSLDITLTGGWQPTEGEVTVSLDATEFGLTEGEQIAILHEHDGTVETLGTFTVTAGKLTFTTSSFSSFYGYTVDFEYNGVWYSIGGGSYVYLYELFAMLGIDRSASAVSGVSFSDNTLLSAEEVISDGYTGETAWLIHSLKPFDTAEWMKIDFYDSTSITLSVYDANYTTLDKDCTFYNGDTVGPVSVTKNVNITLDGTVTVNGKINILSGATVTITGSGTFKRGIGFAGNMFQVTGGGKLIITGSAEDNIVIDGGANFTVADVADSTRKLLTVNSGAETTGAAISVGVAGDSPSIGTVKLEYVTLQNLYTESGQASAIYATGKVYNAEDTVPDKIYSTVKMDHVTVKNCATLSGQSILLFNDSTADLTYCTIDDNYSGGTYAGAVKAGGPNQFCQLTMTNCTAKGNYSSGWGGVVLWAANSSFDGLSSKATIDGCTFTGNTARWLGGALSNEAIMEVKNTTIQGNIAMAGGGIATFPFTLTKSTDLGGNACGLTLGSENEITGNTAYATGEFTPYSKKDTDGVDGDDATISDKITYTGGGGGVWCYMNKEAWTCSLEIGRGNTISGNESNNVGGGVYIDKVKGKTTTLSITGAEISENKAVNGGGVAVTAANVTISSGEIKSNKADRSGGGIYVESGSAEVSGSGYVTDNQAANGGGLYIHDGSITVSGGLITTNRAVGEYTGVTTKVDPTNMSGVGGGIFLEKGEFTLSGTDIGIYRNEAKVAANDVYARGENTTVTLPDVSAMNLTGIPKDEAEPTGWYVDYKEDDREYPQSVIGKDNPGRYEASTEGNVKVEHTTLARNQTTFYCLTLGIAHPGYGTLTITKSGIDERDNDGTTEKQSSLFLVEGTTRVGSKQISLYVTVVGNDSVKIVHLPDGVYTVTELTDWTWRYDKTSQTYHPTGSTASEEKVTINALKPDWDAAFVNERKKQYWLSGDNYCANLWGDSGVTTRDEKRKKSN